MWDRFTVRRKVNSLARRLGSTRAPAMPIRAWIASTSRCNLRCRTCPGHAPEHEYPPETFLDMPAEVFRHVRDELLPGLEEVYLSGAGEPFLARSFYDILDAVLDGRRFVWVVTNGTIIERNYIERLVKNPSLIRVSVDGTTPETLESIRLGAKFERVMAFLETVKELADKGAHPRFEFQISWVVTRSNVEQMADGVDLAHRFGVRAVCFGNFAIEDRLDEFALGESLIHDPETVRPHWERAYRRGRALGVQVGPIVFPGDNGKGDGNAGEAAASGAGMRIPQCPLPWWSTYIESNGDVKPCCGFPPDFSLGNVREKPFRLIWNGRAYRELRRTVNTPEMPESCKRCTMPVRF